MVETWNDTNVIDSHHHRERAHRHPSRRQHHERRACTRVRCSDRVGAARSMSSSERSSTPSARSRSPPRSRRLRSKCARAHSGQPARSRVRHARACRACKAPLPPAIAVAGSTDTGRASMVPSAPASLAPQQTTDPSGRSAQDCSGLTATATVLLTPVTAAATVRDAVVASPTRTLGACPASMVASSLAQFSSDTDSTTSG